ncbi:MAG: hypothetical protein HQL94_03600 [Magnetococcales bacterium]|nr:hypothetical protein [Magnetococcales bacterium]MBF0438383.1 hypothetical protein [Magnetococcales bacterium]
MAEITQDAESRPNNKKVIFLVAILVGLVLLGVVGLQYFKRGHVVLEAEQVSRELTSAEKAAALARKQALAPPVADSAKEAAPVWNPATQGDLAIENYSQIVMETGEVRINAHMFNHGRQPLAAAWVNIDFLNSNGEVLFTRAVNPLVVSGGIFGDQSAPLAEGTGRQFHVSADEVPFGWTGKVDAKVTRLWYEASR